MARTQQTTSMLLALALLCINHVFRVPSFLMLSNSGGYPVFALIWDTLIRKAWQPQNRSKFGSENGI